uniref:Uncharacterized protein n=1 Tax=Otus sunia TaxID=257818 RepID=A0A8C8A4Q5_9STRI
MWRTLVFWCGWFFLMRPVLKMTQNLKLCGFGVSRCRKAVSCGNLCFKKHVLPLLNFWSN